MSTVKISGLTNLATAPDVDDLMVIVDSSAVETKYVTINDLFTDAALTNPAFSGVTSFAGITISDGGTVTTIDINGGSIDGTEIGSSSKSSGAFTTLSATSEITATGGISLPDTVKATFGADDDLEIHHDGSNSYIKDGGTGSLYIQGSSYVLLQNAGGVNMFSGQSGNKSVVYHSGDNKLETSSTGITVTGTAVADGIDSTTYRSAVYGLTGTDIDPTNGDIQYKTLSANTTFTESLASGDAVLLFLTGGSSYTVTWPSGIVWVSNNGNVAPTLTANDVILLSKVSSAIRAVYVGSYA